MVSAGSLRIDGQVKGQINADGDVMLVAAEPGRGGHPGAERHRWPAGSRATSSSRARRSWPVAAASTATSPRRRSSSRRAASSTARASWTAAAPGQPPARLRAHGSRPAQAGAKTARARSKVP